MNLSTFTHAALAASVFSLGLCCGAAQAADAPESATATTDAASNPGAVRFKYAWPDALKLTLEQTRLSSQSAGDDTHSTSLTVGVDLRTTRSGDKLHLDFGKMQLLNVPNLNELPPDQRAMMIVTAGATLPDWDISADGHYAGAQDVASFRNSLFEAGRRYANGKFDNEGLRRAIDQLVVEESLNETLRSEWSAMVSDWAGIEFNVGETYGGEFETRIPQAPDVPVMQRTRVKVTALGPCMRAGIERRCADIESLSELDEDSVRKLVSVFNEHLAQDETAKASGQSIADISVTTSIKLRTEIDTLVPHVFILDQRNRTTLSNNGKEVVLEQRSYVGDEFRYSGDKAP